MKIDRPAPGEYHMAFERYVALVPEDDALPVLARQPAQVRAALEKISGDRAGFRYAPDKWSIREVVGHFTDAERVFGFRAMTFARGDKTPLPSFEENDYAAIAGHDRYALPDLVAEFEALRAQQRLDVRPPRPGRRRARRHGQRQPRVRAGARLHHGGPRAAPPRRARGEVRSRGRRLDPTRTPTLTECAALWSRLIGR